MSKISNLWYSRSKQNWLDALDLYWSKVKKENIELEMSLNELKLSDIKSLDQDGWYNFLLEKYFRWKYTDPKRYYTTTKNLKRYQETGDLATPHNIKYRLLRIKSDDIKSSLMLASQIKGLGMAGASGLLSLMYPEYFGTVDQFVIDGLKTIPDLPDYKKVIQINSLSIKLDDAVVLITIMRSKARELNEIFHTDFWTPRKIDMVLWSLRE